MTAPFHTEAFGPKEPDFSGLRLIHVVRQYLPNIGGLEDVVRNLAAGQKDRFASVEIVTLDRLFREPETVLPHRETIEDVEVIRIPYRGSSRYPIAPSVLANIKNADLVHVHGVDFFYDALALTRIWHGRKLVATTHGGFFHTPKFARLKSVWFQTLTRLSSSQYAALACCSASDLDLFNRIAPGKTQLIENGADIRKFQNASARGARKRLLTLGRFSSNKRLDRLLDLMAVLSAEDPAWHLEIAGTESDLTREDLAQRAQALGLEDKVRVHLGLSNSGLRALMGQCSFFVSASQYEGFGLALIEAMSAGLIPVVHANDAFVALARKHPLIRNVDFADAAAAADAVRSAYNRLEHDVTLRQGVINASSEYGWDARSRLYDDLYLKALAG
jgi:alpha-1,3-mannosyltransferase